MAFFCDCEDKIHALEKSQRDNASEIKFMKREITLLNGYLTRNFCCIGGVNGCYPTEPSFSDINSVIKVVSLRKSKGYVRINCPVGHHKKLNMLNCYFERGQAVADHGEYGYFMQHDVITAYVFVDENLRGNVLEFLWVNGDEKSGPWYLEFSRWD